MFNSKNIKRIFNEIKDITLYMTPVWIAGIGMISLVLGSYIISN